MGRRFYGFNNCFRTTKNTDKAKSAIGTMNKAISKIFILKDPFISYFNYYISDNKTDQIS